MKHLDQTTTAINADAEPLASVEHENRPTNARQFRGIEPEKTLPDVGGDWVKHDATMP
jgi:hypothetical protein